VSNEASGQKDKPECSSYFFAMPKMPTTRLEPASGEPGSAPPLGVACALMLAAALVLGFAYNAASPLGVRAHAVAGRGPAPTPVRPGGSPPALYENETAAITVESSAGSAPIAAPPVPAQPSEPVVMPSTGTLTWPETRKLLAEQKILLVDARAAVYFATEHIPGAVSLPADSAPAALLAFAEKYPRDQAIVIYCGSAQCPLANKLAGILKDQLTFTNLREMPGGFVEYRQSEAQAAKGAPQ